MTSAHPPSQATVLGYNCDTLVWESCGVDLLAEDVVLPEFCYIFLDAGEAAAWYKKHSFESDRKRILAPFNAPDFLSSKTCTDLNGYFGSRTSFAPRRSPGTLDDIGEGYSDRQSRIKSLSTWFRILTKKVLRPEEQRGPDGKDYMWYEMGFFTHWKRKSPESTTTSNRVLCIDTPPEMKVGMWEYLTQGSSPSPPPLEIRDPFAMLPPLLDLVIKLCDDNTWGITRLVRVVELSRGERPDFPRLRDLARHTGHLAEVEQVAIETLEGLAKRQESAFHILENVLDESYRTQAIEYLAFQLQTMRSLRWRADSTNDRLTEEINLAYNMIASSDNVIMKSITLLTMIFLPATFIAALFSTTFFTNGDNGWQFSDKLWIYWAVSVPFTVAVVLVWWAWLGGSHGTIRSRWLADPKSNGAEKSHGA